MAKTTTEKKEKLISALSLWRSYDVTGELNAELFEPRVDEATGLTYTPLTYDGRAAEDGRVRIFAYYARPKGDKKCPAILLLKEAGKPFDVELMWYFVQRGYAVLMPDYSGELACGEAATKSEETAAEYTVYPASLGYANYEKAQGMYDVEGISSDKTCWYEWTYVALYSLEYLKTLKDVDKLGVVGVRTGGEVAWKVMLSSDVACGVPINAAGWLSVNGAGKFAELSAINMTEERHRYIAAVDSQSYAPFVKCPVLMLCALSDHAFDADRAYDTYVRIGGEKGNDGSAIVYSADSGSCIGQGGLTDMEMFLEKHLKGREVFIPAALNVTVKENGGVLRVEVSADREALLEEIGICYAEADGRVKSAYREWQCVHKATATEIKDGKTECSITPYAGPSMAFIYAYAKCLNGFKVVSKIVGKPCGAAARAEGSRMLFSGDDLDCFSVSRHEDYSVAGIFLEKEATPKLVAGYGNFYGAYSLGGIKTYKIGSPRYVAKDGAMLKFDAYSRLGGTLSVGVETTDEHGGVERYFCLIPVKAGGKWKRIILEAKDFKNETYGRPLPSFSSGNALAFQSEREQDEIVVTNVLWL